MLLFVLFNLGHQILGELLFFLLLVLPLLLIDIHEPIHRSAYTRPRIFVSSFCTCQSNICLLPITVQMILHIVILNQHIRFRTNFSYHSSIIRPQLWEIVLDELWWKLLRRLLKILLHRVWVTRLVRWVNNAWLSIRHHIWSHHLHFNIAHYRCGWSKMHHPSINEVLLCCRELFKWIVF